MQQQPQWSSGRPGGRPRSRPGGRRSVHAEPVWPLLCEALAERVDASGRSSLDVVDAGGGTGSFAVPVAELGHTVTVIDPSLDSLAALERRATHAGVTDRVRGVQGDAGELSAVLAAESADVATCHHVLEFVDEPARVLTAVARALRPGGLLSVLAANRHAAVLAKAVTGHLEDARRVLSDPDGSWGQEDPLPRRFTFGQLEDLLTGAGFALVASHGLHALRDLVPETVLGEPKAERALADLEADAGEHPEFRAVASQLHVVART